MVQSILLDMLRMIARLSTWVFSGIALGNSWGWR